jgi:hypothetical protein
MKSRWRMSGASRRSPRPVRAASYPYCAPPSRGRNITFVQPAVLATTGMDPGAVMTATCLASACATLLNEVHSLLHVFAGLFVLRYAWLM